MFFIGRLFLLAVLSLIVNPLSVPVSVSARLPQSEVDALDQIARTMGATDWTFDGNTACDIHESTASGEETKNITCGVESDSDISHVIVLKFKRCNLRGVLPPELVQLPYLQEVDFAYNYLNGSMPVEWASTQLKFISVFVNRLSGNIPTHLGNITSLTNLDLEANQFSGAIPPELGKLVNLKQLKLSSNMLTGNLPMELSDLRNLTDFRINDNYFNGSIPDFIQNWEQLMRLEIQGSGLHGPIPSSISVLGNLKQLRISDINGPDQPFPVLSNMTSLSRIFLRNCSLSGEIPTYIWGFEKLRILDLSFNNLTGELPEVSTRILRFIFLSGNSLSGNIPQSLLKRGTDVDLSYNNFTWQSSEQPACRERENLNLNLYRSFSVESNLSRVLPCMDNFICDQHHQSFFINCGGDTLRVNGSKYRGDAAALGGAARYHLIDKDNSGFSSTGDFTDDNNEQNLRYAATLNSSDLPELYTTGRIAPISLTYFGYCLENGNYTVSLHFAEIQFTDDRTYGSLGRRIFDILVQGKLVEKDFNIAAEASGVLKPIAKAYNTTVTDNVLEIHLTWAGKGTKQIPTAGVYGPLISAISVVHHNFKPENKKNAGMIIGIVIGVLGFCLTISALSILYWRRNLRTKSQREKDFDGLDSKTIYFTLKQMRTATNYFDAANKIGEGGFGPVYRGRLSDGTVIAVKQLSSKSRQGNREFLNEVGMISCLQHPNLVKLFGCCIEGDQLLLVYEYMENNSLARVLFGREQCQVKLDWPSRQKICIGIARGLAFLHEESRFKIVHRDIKPTNILLDGDLNPKISDFGLAKLDEEENTHISTRVAGTIGYMAPEYALWGYLTHKADVYSFGVLALEVVSGKNNTSYVPTDNCTCLLDWACQLQKGEKLVELVDPKLGSDYNKEEAVRMLNISLLCTNGSPSLRPSMSEVLSMLEGKTTIPDVVPEAGNYSDDLRFKALRDHRKHQRSSRSESHSAMSARPHGSLSATTNHDLYEVNQESFFRSHSSEPMTSSTLSSSTTDRNL